MAARYFINGGVDAKWSTSGNWSATDGGAASGVKPSASDDVHFTANSPACTVDSAGVALTLDFTGYASTITMTSTITVSGAYTGAAGMTYAGLGALILKSAATHTANGKSIPKLNFQSAVTHTLADAFTCTTLQVGGNTSAANVVVNGFSVTISGDLDLSVNSTGGLSGTTTYILAGTGSIINATSTGILQNSLTINTAGTITFPTGTFRYNTGTLTYTAGTVSCGSCDLNVGVSTTLNTGGSAMTFRDCTLVNATATLTLSSDLYCRDVISSLTTTNQTFAGNKIYVSRNLTLATITTGTLIGTTEIVMTGTGSITTDALTTGRITCPLTFNAPAATITFVSAVGLANFNMGKFKHVAGTVVNLNAESWPTPSGGMAMASLHGIEGVILV